MLRFLLLEKSSVVLANCTVSVQPYSEKVSEIAQIHILENFQNFYWQLQVKLLIQNPENPTIVIIRIRVLFSNKAWFEFQLNHLN